MAGGLVEGPEGLLLVQNRRRDGSLDWSPPGGVIEAPEALIDGLTREVMEETGIEVPSWAGPVYRVEAVAEQLGWHLTVEVHLARSFSGELHVDDPDGIVVDARFVPRGACIGHLSRGRRWVSEPLGAWLEAPWAGERRYSYEVDPDLGVVRV